MAIVYTQVDLISELKVQEQILRDLKIQRVHCESSNECNSSTEGSTAIKSPNKSQFEFHLQPSSPVKETVNKSLTKLVGLVSLSNQIKEHRVYAKAPTTAPFSIAQGTLRANDKLLSPVYFCEHFFSTHFKGQPYLNSVEKFNRSFALNAKKELAFADKKVIQAQKEVITDMIKEISMALLTGKELSSISLPVKVMQPRSQTQTTGEFFANLDLMHAAARSGSNLETFKKVIAFVCSNFFYGMDCQKTLHPYIGETTQGHFADGTCYYAEQIRHNPSTCAMLMVNNDDAFSIDMQLELISAMKSNEIKNYLKGIITIKIRDQVIYATFPCLVVRGVIYGDRRMLLEDAFYFCYPKEQLKAVVKVGGDHRSDLLDGGIYRMSAPIVLNKDKFGSSLFPSLKPKHLSREAKLSHISGSWLESVQVDGTELWNRSHRAYRVQYLEDTLPSDWRFREDLLWMMYGNMQQAQEWKVHLEGVQRSIRKTREAFAKKLKHK